MYTSHLLPIPSLLANEPIRMPINIQLALPDYVTSEAENHIFNVPAAINELMGSSGWRVATRVMKPRVWAPGWDNKQLREFVTRPFGSKERSFPERALRGLRARDFPGLRSLSNPNKQNYPEYEIIHFVGGTDWGHDLSLNVGANYHLTFGALRDGLYAARTRLLIIQDEATENDYYRDRVARLARYIVGSGGPVVLVVSGSDAADIDNYFLNLYAGIIHNQPLSLIAEPNAESKLTVQMFHGEGGDEMLRFDRFRDELYGRIRWVREAKKPLAFDEVADYPFLRETHIGEELASLSVKMRLSGRTVDIFQRITPYLHQSQLKDLKGQAIEAQTSFEKKAAKIGDRASKLERELDWSHETGGAIPISETAWNVPKLQGAIIDLSAQFYRKLIDQASEQAERAPRVVNANFADPRIPGGLYERALVPHKGLEASKEYDLCVDVGPQWDTVPSIVTGRKEFPQRALPVTQQGGHLIQVIFVSEDFSPRLSSAEIWIPSKTGRSFPVKNGEHASESGPVSLRLRAPSLPESSNQKFIEARGRLCLYFGNNLLQSAIVKALIVPSADVALEGVSNEIHIDFRLTDSFREIDQFSTRAIVLNEEVESNWLAGKPIEIGGEPKTAAVEVKELPIALNLTLNDDGSGKNRILVKNHPELPPVWKPYNLLGTTKLLGRARQELANCFYQRNSQDCAVQQPGTKPNIALNAQNGKDYYQFACDLRQLAIFGERLFNIVRDQVILDGTGMSQSDWESSLRQALAKSTVIQVARTGEAEYTFPWAVVYEYRLPDKDNLNYCKVIQEWNAAGIRDKEHEECPFEGTPGHDKNILCPYGFWGLKHYIEQPIPPLPKDNQNDGAAKVWEATKTIDTGATLNISVGVTRDPALSPKAIDEHLKKLATISPVNPPGGADDWSKVQVMLKSADKSPDIVYFLCHGEYDNQNDQPYLGIGLPTGQFKYRVYPNELISWSRGMTSPVWDKPQPLIFINGCHTFALLPDQVLNFVSTFAGFGASGVIGTEVSILLPLATEIAEMLFEAIVKVGMTLSRAMHQVRWKLANKGNLLGLAYTPYGQADLHIVRAT
jgi:hypothetical protein